MTNKHTIDITSGPILKKMLAFSIPLMFSSILQLLFNAADIVVVGRFSGENSLAAVGSNSSIINLVTTLFFGLSIGTNVVAARYFGAKDDKDLSETVHTAMLVSVIGGTILSVIGSLGARTFLEWMDSPDEIIDLAATYLRIYFIGIAASMVYNFGSAVLRAVGDTKRSLYFLVIAGVVNVLLNLFFVISLKLDVAGVAIATVISQFISATLVVICLMRETGAIKLRLSKLKIHKDKLKKLAAVGIPAGFQSMMFSISNAVVQSSVNSLGAIVVSGNSAAVNIEGFVYMAMNTFYQATLAFTSQVVGAGKPERIKKILLYGLGCSFTVGLFLGNTVSIFSKFFVGIYNQNPEVIQIGSSRLMIVAATYALCGMMDTMVGALRGLGYSVLPMLVSLTGACGVRVLWIKIFFSMAEYHVPQTIYVSYPISWAFTLTFHIICFLIVYRKAMRKKLSADIAVKEKLIC